MHLGSQGSGGRHGKVAVDDDQAGLATRFSIGMRGNVILPPAYQKCPVGVDI